MITFHHRNKNKQEQDGIDTLNHEAFSEADLYTHNSPIWMYVAPILIIVGVTENCLSILVLTRDRFIHVPSRVTLVALAIVDCVVLFIGLIRYWLNVTFDMHPVEWNSAWFLFSSHLSSCLVALLSVERFLAVCLPRKIFRPSIDKLGTVLLIVVLTDSNDKDEHKKYVCSSESDWVALWQDIADVLLLFVLPCIVITTCNIYIILAIRRNSKRVGRSGKRRDTLPTISSKPVESEQTAFGRKSPNRIRGGEKHRNVRITTTLLCVTFAFLLCNLPFAVVHIMRTADSSRRTREWNIAWLVTYILVYVNNCLNFPIYVVSQEQFRNELKNLCCTKRFGRGYLSQMFTASVIPNLLSSWDVQRTHKRGNYDGTLSSYRKLIIQKCDKNFLSVDKTTESMKIHGTS
ncbi:unnamed protein product [Echinostoma caproni]|uniref:G_PROTEIN_RECEP_F1_2 domain-containing protein n=1 Tax=Echinostoma caproni TaxID=27848 RepID=A0A183A5J7_9TREM|nr:unnamed protein product [Echinostoma caproni]